MLASVAGSACNEKLVDRSPRTSVGPWDFPDAPNPDPVPTTGDPVADPLSLVSARDFKAKFDSGIEVELVALSRNMWGPEEVERRVDERSWNPDGSPFMGVLFDFGGQPFSRATENENKGARFLAFRISTPTNLRADIYGYVPDFARQGTPKPELHGRDVPMPVDLYSHGSATYRFPVVVDDRSAKRYLFALAAGEWKTVARFSKLPATATNTTIATGPFGKLVMELPPEPKPGQIEFSKRTIPGVTFRIVSSKEPPTHVYRIILFDKKGVEQGPHDWYSQTGVAGFPLSRYAELGHIEIIARPYQWAEFTDVHYDPDPKKWETGYWLNEGASKTVDGGDVSLEGILRPELDGRSWTKTEFFAPDGKIWREYPAQNLRSRLSGSNWPSGEVLAGLLKLSPAVAAANENVVVRIFESQTDVPGQNLGTEVSSPFGRNQFDREINHAIFVRPKSPYIQFEVRRSNNEWKTIASLDPPSGPFPKFNPEQLEQIRRGVGVGVNAFGVIVRSDGTLDYFIHHPDLTNSLDRGLAKWNPRDVEMRLMVRLKSGGRRQIFNNGASSSGSIHFDFSLGPGSEPMLESYRTKVFLKDIAKFEVETRGYGKPKYLVAKLPK